MQFSPNNQQGLLSLVEALKSGMDPNTGVSLLGMIQGDQAQRVAGRQERLGGLASLLMDAAGRGMPLEGAEALAEAAPGPAGPAVQSMLSSLYPTTERPVTGSFPGQTMEVQSEISPTYMPDPMEGLQQQLMQQQVQLGGLELEAAQAQAMPEEGALTPEEIWGGFATSMANARAQEMDAQTAYMTFIQANPEAASVLGMNPDQVKGILVATFGQGAVTYGGSPTG